jgi:hypothetical protein
MFRALIPLLVAVLTVAAADANAAKFGRTKSEREAERAAREIAARHLDGHKREE